MLVSVYDNINITSHLNSSFRIRIFSPEREVRKSNRIFICRFYTVKRAEKKTLRDLLSCWMQRDHDDMLRRCHWVPFLVIHFSASLNFASAKLRESERDSWTPRTLKISCKLDVFSLLTLIFSWLVVYFFFLSFRVENFPHSPKCATFKEKKIQLQRQTHYFKSHDNKKVMQNTA